MRRAPKIIIALLLTIAGYVLGLGTSYADAGDPALTDRRAMPLLGTLKDPEAWRAYKAHFVTEAGRVVDTANKGISHSEGQGYGMLLAVAATIAPRSTRSGAGLAPISWCATTS